VTDLVAVRHSYTELEQAHAWLSESITRANPPSAKGEIRGLITALLTDKNQVELQLPCGQSLNAAQQAAVGEAKRRLGTMLNLGSWSGGVSTEACGWSGPVADFNCDPPLRGGTGIHSDQANWTTIHCTAGFNVRSNSDYKWYVMTAGHCGEEGTGWWTEQPT
jgi:hypothetical protein